MSTVELESHDAMTGNTSYHDTTHYTVSVDSFRRKHQMLPLLEFSIDIAVQNVSKFQTTRHHTYSAFLLPGIVPDKTVCHRATSCHAAEPPLEWPMLQIRQTMKLEEEESHQSSSSGP